MQVISYYSSHGILLNSKSDVGNSHQQEHGLDEKIPLKTALFLHRLGDTHVTVREFLDSSIGVEVDPSGKNYTISSTTIKIKFSEYLFRN